MASKMEILINDITYKNTNELMNNTSNEAHQDTDTRISNNKDDIMHDSEGEITDPIKECTPDMNDKIALNIEQTIQSVETKETNQSIENN